MPADISKELHDTLVRLALSMYLGEHCKYCDKEYTTIDELKDVVRADLGPSGTEFRLACQACYNTWMKENDETSNKT